MQEIITDKTKKSNYTLNALRGFAAISVVLYHVVYYGKLLDPGYLPVAFKYFYDDGIFNVLIFFVISGTVISLSNKKALNNSTVLDYLRKRAMRIYPIYAVSLIVALLISKVAYSSLTIIGNFTFLQILFTNIITENGPIWSLHYEIIFYLLFIPVSMYFINPVKVALAALIIGLINYYYFPLTHSPLLTSYCFGFTFWLTGLIIAKYFNTKSAGSINYRKLVSFLFLLLSVPYLNKLKMVMNKYIVIFLGHKIEFPYSGDANSWFKMAISFSDFSYLPFCFMAVILFSEFEFKFKRAFEWFLQLLPALGIFSFYRISGYFDFTKLIFPCSCYFISCMLFINSSFFDQISSRVIRALLWLGSVSYGIYIIHMPLLVLFSHIALFSGTGITFIIRIISYLIITLLTAYLLENQFQRFIIKLFFKRNFSFKKN